MCLFYFALCKLSVLNGFARHLFLCVEVDVYLINIVVKFPVKQYLLRSTIPGHMLINGGSLLLSLLLWCSLSLAQIASN